MNINGEYAVPQTCNGIWYDGGGGWMNIGGHCLGWDTIIVTAQIAHAGNVLSVMTSTKMPIQISVVDGHWTSGRCSKKFPKKCRNYLE